MPDPERAIWCGGVRLDASAVTTEDEKPLIWVPVAETGAWEGHSAGEFELTAEIFKQLQTNLRRHPSYRAEPKPPDGRVIQWDFHHASEEHSSFIAVEGAPAQGWVYDVALGSELPVAELSEKARAGLAAKQAQGVETFWTLTEWLPRAKGYVEDGSYQWASIAIWPDTTDPKTGENIGWYMSSVALTNDPFLQGMLELSIAAMRSAALQHRHVRLSLPVCLSDLQVALEDVYTLFSSWESCMAKMKEQGYDTEKAEKVCGSICGQRLTFSFDQCVKDVMAQGKSEESAQNICGAAHQQKSAKRRLYRYYDPWDVPITTADAFQRLKDIFELGELASVVDVAGQLAKLKAYAAGETPPPGVDAAQLIQQIRQLLQLELLTDTETILAKCEELLAKVAAEPAPALTREPMPDPVPTSDSLLIALAKRLGVPSTPADVERVIFERLQAGEDAKMKLRELFTALGVEDPEAAVAQLADWCKKIAQLEELIPEVASLRTTQAETEDASLEEDMAMAAQRLGQGWETVKDAIRVFRGGEIRLDPKAEDFPKQLAARQAARKRFLEKFPRPPVGQEHLFTSIATVPSAKPGAPAAPQQLARAQVGADGVLRLVAPAAAPGNVLAPPPPPGDGAVDLAALRAEVEGYDGPNLGAKCIAYVQAKATAAGKPLSFEAAHEKGSILAGQLTGRLAVA